MKTTKQIKMLVENIVINNTTENKELTKVVRNSFLPLFQFNIDESSSEDVQSLFNQI